MIRLSIPRANFIFNFTKPHFVCDPCASFRAFSTFHKLQKVCMYFVMAWFAFFRSCRRKRTSCIE